MNISPAQLANVALQVMAAADIRATDENLAAVQMARQMLKAIAAGQLVVSEPPKVDPSATPAVDSKPSE